MPESPEVECLRRSLERDLMSARVVAVRVFRGDVLRAVGFDRGRDREQRRPLLGASIGGLERHGKELAILEAGPDGRVLRVRLGMTGGLRLDPIVPGRALARLPHEHVRWTLEGASGRLALRHVDPRRFGDLVVFTDPESYRHDRARLGIDGITASPRAMATRLGRDLARSRRSLKAALLDQGVVAGLGNIYADEALFRARLDPQRGCRTVGTGEWQTLARSIREVLRQAVKAGGSTLRDYRDARGVAGSAQRAHQAYGRAGMPCLRCGATLQSTLIAGRTTIRCSSCQH